MAITKKEIDLYYKKVVDANEVYYLERCINTHNASIKSSAIYDNLCDYITSELSLTPFENDMIMRFMKEFECDISTETGNNDGRLTVDSASITVYLVDLSITLHFMCTTHIFMYCNNQEYTCMINNNTKWLPNINSFYESVPIWSSLMQDCIKFINNPILLTDREEEEEEEDEEDAEEEEEAYNYDKSHPMYTEYRYIYPIELYDIMISKTTSYDEKIKEVKDYLDNMVSNFIYIIMKYLTNRELNLKYYIY